MSKCIIILSQKCSGSSACQYLLARFSDIKHVEKTRHYQNETLYWTKAASILGMPQRNMIDSEVPLDYATAKRDILTLLADNLGAYDAPAGDRDLVFDGWRALCRKYGPIFLEKSPHHLLQWSALELIVECMERVGDVDFLLIGLVRNPMDTLYSAFRQWRSRPEDTQTEWVEAYRNLHRLKDRVGDRLVVVRYEDMVTSLDSLQPVFDFCGVSTEGADSDYLHRRSLSKWKKDRFFGFGPSDELVALAETYGYERGDLVNHPSIIWPLYRELSRGLSPVTAPVKRVLKKLVRA